jgi:dienelactone hydrolase
VTAADSPEQITTIAGWEKRAGHYRTAIAEILGNPGNANGQTRPTSAPQAEILGVEKLDGYTRGHLRIRTGEGDWIPAYLLVPLKLAATRVPAMICLHQTVAQGKEEPCGIKGDPQLAFALQLVEQGFVCIAPDAIGFGERIRPGGQPYDDSVSFYRKYPRWSFMGKMIADVSCVVDYLRTLPQVDSLQIGCIGHSHGAYGSLFAAAFEPRISATIASCGSPRFAPTRPRSAGRTSPRSSPTLVSTTRPPKSPSTGSTSARSSPRARFSSGTQRKT